MRIILYTVAAATLAAGIGAYAQTGSPQTDALLAARRAEQKRHESVYANIQNERIDAQAQLRMDLNHCTASRGPAYERCSAAANEKYSETLRKIQDEQIKEDAVHAKNINNIDHQSDVQCTRPDCVNMPKGKPVCDKNCGN